MSVQALRSSKLFSITSLKGIDFAPLKTPLPMSSPRDVVCCSPSSILLNYICSKLSVSEESSIDGSCNMQQAAMLISLIF